MKNISISNFKIQKMGTNLIVSDLTSGGHKNEVVICFQNCEPEAEAI